MFAANRQNTIESMRTLLLSPPNNDGPTIKSDWGVFLIVIPPRYGGWLTVEVGHELKLPSPMVRVITPDQEKHEAPKDSNKVEIEIDEGKRGNGHVIVLVNTEWKEFKITARYTERGVAREKDGSALVPWNFWFFPYSLGGEDEDDSDKTAYASSKMDPLKKYDDAFGNPGALDWELAHHADPTRTAGPADGHCHNAAPASILFETPPADGVEYNGVKFTCEELKLLATEYVGTHKALKNAWQIHKKPNGELASTKPSKDDSRFREPLRKLLTTLRSEIRDKGEALSMELRDDKGVSSGERWNHAVFEYETNLWQEHANDLFLATGLTTLLANRDILENDFSSSGLPATPFKGSAHPGSYKGKTENRRLHYTLRYRRAGQFDPTATDTAWIGIYSKRGLVHAPRVAVRVLRPTAEPQNPGVLIDGNRAVLKANVFKLLTLRDKYK